MVVCIFFFIIPIQPLYIPYIPYITPVYNQFASRVLLVITEFCVLIPAAHLLLNASVASASGLEHAVARNIDGSLL